MAPIIAAAKKDPALTSLVCVSAQHREMLDSVLQTFSIQPDYDLQYHETWTDLTKHHICDLRKINSRVGKRASGHGSGPW